MGHCDEYYMLTIATPKLDACLGHGRPMWTASVAAGGLIRVSLSHVPFTAVDPFKVITHNPCALWSIMV